jgi:hypothetical protein
MISTNEEPTSSEEDGEETDILLDGGVDNGFFSEDNIKNFRRAMKQVVLPPCLSTLPPNLGKERHGKLKAAQWYTLFGYIIPLVILDLYLDDIRNIDTESNQAQFIMNTAYLAQCTNILFSREITESHIKRFKERYKRYSEKVGALFADVKVQPNHHCALHIPDHMRGWGPLSKVAEFAGERLIGFLQKIKTNDLIGELVN